MNNIQRICELCILNGIYTPEEIQAMLEKGLEIPMHTKKKWLNKGKKVKDGMKGYKTKLWVKKDEENKFYLVDVVLYSDTMVENAS